MSTTKVASSAAAAGYEPPYRKKQKLELTDVGLAEAALPTYEEVQAMALWNSLRHWGNFFEEAYGKSGTEVDVSRTGSRIVSDLTAGYEPQGCFIKAEEVMAVNDEGICYRPRAMPSQRTTIPLEKWKTMWVDEFQMSQGEMLSQRIVNRLEEARLRLENKMNRMSKQDKERTSIRRGVKTRMTEEGAEDAATVAETEDAWVWGGCVGVGWMSYTEADAPRRRQLQ